MNVQNYRADSIQTYQLTEQLIHGKFRGDNPKNYDLVTQALTRLDDDEKMTLCLNEGHSGQRGGAQFMNFVNEFGLYNLILSSRKPEAKKFKRWVTHEVLPSIRKYGFYRIQQPEQEKIHVKITGREKFNMLKEKFPEIDFSDAFGVIDTVKRYDSNGYYNEEYVHYYYLYMNPIDYEKLCNEPFLLADKFLERIIPRRIRKKKNIELPTDSLG